MAMQNFQYRIVFAIGLFFFVPKVSSTKSATPPYEDAQISIRLIDPKDVIVARGQPASLSCQVYSNSSDVELRWLYNGQVILGNDTRFSQLDNGTLTVPKVSGRKVNGTLEGDYQCSVRNQYGALLSSPAKLRVAVIGKDFQEQPKDATVGEGQPLVLPCKIHSFPKPEVTWEYNHQLLPHTARHVPLPSGSLLITSTEFSDGGSYSCSVVNSILKNKPKVSNVAKITVVSSLPAAPQHLPLGLSPNLTALVGEDVNLYCAASGWPHPILRWYKGDHLFSRGSSLLRLKKVTDDTSGTYICSATNSYGSSNQTYYLQVQQPPYFNHTLETKLFPPPALLKTPCHAFGIPTPKVSWLANGTLMDFYDDRIRFNNSQLYIGNTLSTDAGIYQCVAENAAGKAWMAVQYYSRIPAEGVPPPPISIQCVPYNSTSVCVRWSDPPNVDPKAYLLFSYHQGRGPEYLAVVKQHLATGLNESTTYSFFVRLFVTIGTSDRSSSIECTTGTIGERNLRVNLKDTNSANLTWLPISSDFSCDNRTIEYRIHWKMNDNSTTLNVKYVRGVTNVLINDLKVGNTYQFRVASVTEKHATSDWVPLEVTEKNLKQTKLKSSSLYDLYVSELGSTTVELRWSTNYKDISLVYVCYFEAYSDKSCEFSDGLENVTTRSNHIKIRDLNPKTAYEFFTMATFDDGTQDIQIIETVTLPEGPVVIQDISYWMVNATTACVKWRAPYSHANGKYIRYTVLYKGQDCVTNSINVTASIANINKACWIDQIDGSNIMSVLVPQLNPDESYSLLIQPELNSTVLAAPEINMSTNPSNKYSVNTEKIGTVPNGLGYEQKLGIALGISIALCGFICCSACLTCIIIKKRKARTVNSTRFYINEMRPTCHLRGGCVGAPREMENLLINGCRTSNIPTVTPNLDTKGDASYPNKHMNGTAQKHKPVNSRTSNGHVHIMENPQYSFSNIERPTTNGQPSGLKPSNQYDEDANSNLSDTNIEEQTSIFRDYADTSSGNSSVSSLGSHEITQLTCLDTSGVFQVSFRNVPVPLGPNG